MTAQTETQKPAKAEKPPKVVETQCQSAAIPAPAAEPKKELPTIIVKRRVEHKLTATEIADKSLEMRRAYRELRSTETEIDSQKALWKARLAEAEARHDTIAALLDAGQELRAEECSVEYFKDGKKQLTVLATGEKLPLEPMTQDDMQQDLIRAEQDFEKREEITLWNAAPDLGVLVVGRLAGKWFSALRLKVGKFSLDERLDSEQKSVKKRWDAVQTAAKRALEWIKANVKEFEGFKPMVEKAVEPHKEREE